MPDDDVCPSLALGDNKLHAKGRQTHTHTHNKERKLLNLVVLNRSHLNLRAADRRNG
jgi:hypothetical protein